ncbi:ChaB family protein [Thermoleptolyngbya oregonensis NK1-22]|uniref:ChaB family protein n=1 Tax=Thermoleptolyngbya oregonensis NK1-22 TaxID=2547457 RepID=A0AA96Y4S5_9CYAN|nr:MULTISPECIES: ChaB family protein [Cyanophyceae]WOB43935.1 ChaB family protein [Thermoleptolyngbya oregonensis NK1-22]BAU44008.1 ChaB protein [Leptolyngbya sp. O-77]HIK39443.1 ChaB family protein [Thermoleptolyngbya sp. M55_K2018_002]
MTSAFAKPPAKCVSAAFKDQVKLQDAVQRLLNRGVPKERISIVGRNFQSEARITGFLTKKDVILDGLASGAFYGSLFGSVLSLLTGVGVLFIPFLGAVVAAGPLAAALLGATSGALYGALGAGLGSALMSLGMPQDKAAIYQTRVQAGEFLLVVEVPDEKSGETFLLLQSAGGEEVAITEMQIPQESDGEMTGSDQISPEIRADLSTEAQQTFLETYNQTLSESSEKSNALMKAWERIKQLFERDDKGIFSKRKADNDQKDSGTS